MDNLISLYRGLPGNRQFNGIQGLPYFVFNPLRNLLFTKEDISAETQNEPQLGDDDETPCPGAICGAGAAIDESTCVCYTFAQESS